MQQTLAGRVLIGAFWRVGAFLYADVRALRAQRAGLRSAVAAALLWCVPVIAWLKYVCGMPLWLYFLGDGGAGERHPADPFLRRASRARLQVPERIAIVEGSWILGPMFLFNNLHSLHHEDRR